MAMEKEEARPTPQDDQPMIVRYNHSRLRALNASGGRSRGRATSACSLARQIGTIRADHAGAEPAPGATGPTAEAAALGWLR
jgi:hypothetical protein